MKAQAESAGSAGVPIDEVFKDTQSIALGASLVKGSLIDKLHDAVHETVRPWFFPSFYVILFFYLPRPRRMPPTRIGHPAKTSPKFAAVQARFRKLYAEKRQMHIATKRVQKYYASTAISLSRFLTLEVSLRLCID